MNEQDKTFVDAAWYTAERMLQEKGEVHMMAVLIKRSTGELNLIPGSVASSKRVFAAVIKGLVERAGYDMVVMLSEAWMLTAPIDGTDLDEIDKKGLAEHPDRVEVIMVSYKTKEGEQGMLIRKLMRDRGDTPYIGVSLPMPPAAESVDRFLDILWTEKH